MSKKNKEPSPPPPTPEELKAMAAEKQWDQVAYNVVFSMIKGITLGLLGTLLIKICINFTWEAEFQATSFYTHKKTAIASGIAFGAGQGYADVYQELQCIDNEKKEEEEERKREEEEKRKEPNPKDEKKK